jgi:AraC-like DNA-binding protein
MQIDFNFIVLFQLLTILQGFTTGFLLLSSIAKYKQNLWLGILVLAMTLQVLDRFLSNAGIYRDNNWLYFLPVFFTWMYGVLLYFYLQNAYNQYFTFKKSYLWHFLPALIQFIFYVLIFAHSLDFKTWFWVNIHKPYTRFIDYYVGIILIFAYLFRSYENLKKVDSSLKKFIIALMIFYVIATVDPLFNSLYPPAQKPKFYLTEFVLPVFTYWLALLVLWRERNQSKTLEKTKPQRVDANAEQTQKIVEVMNSEQLYLNPEFSLNDLAQKVEMTANTVSHCLNVGVGKSFNDFVNAYRVEEVKRRLQTDDVEKLTILGIAFESGFNSKATFNRVFKEMTGFSPKDYKNKVSNYNLGR